MAMPDTFDPRSCPSGPACVQALRETFEIRVSQRLGARLLALARREIQLSPALLEAATPGSDLEHALLDERWSGCETTESAALLIAPWGVAVAQDEGVALVTPDEADSAPATAPLSAPPPSDVALVVAQPSPLRALSARSAEATEPPCDDLQLREAARTLFESEDAAELVETLRRLFRAALASGLDPVPLLGQALLRDKRPLRIEVGTLTRQHLDRETGRALEDVQSDDEARVRDAIHVLMRLPGTAPLSALVLPALTPLLSDPRALRQVIAVLGQSVHLVAHDADHAESFLEALLDQLAELESPERFTLSRFILAAQEPWPALPRVLFRRLRSTIDTHAQAWYGNVLARMMLDDVLREQLVDALVDLYERQGQDVALAERLKATFLFLGARPLERLTERARVIDHGMQRSYLIDLWTTTLAGGHPHPPKTMLAELLANEIAARNRAAILVMIRSSTATGGRVDLMAEPALRTHLEAHEWLRDAVIGVLLEEAVHLEEPDDLGALGLLARLGCPAVEAAFERAREEAALDSRAAPYRFRVFAHVAASQAAAPWLTDMAELALGWPFLRRLELPVTIAGLGQLGRVPGLSEEALATVLAQLLPDDPEATLRFAEPRVRAALEMIESSTCTETIQDAVEQRLERIVSAEAPTRDLLVAALLGLEALMSRPKAPLRVESIAVTLARMVLQKSRETSLDRVLADALREETEGQGVRIPTAWSKEDRDLALVILGKAASHAETPEGLHRMITARLAAFTEDWLDAHERGENLYLHRDTPLWRIVLDLADRRPSEHVIEATVRVGLRALEVHRHAPGNLALERREEIQRLLGHLTWLAPQEPVAVRGSMSLDIPKTALATLTALATRENENARGVLEEIVTRVPERLRPQLEGFLSFQRRKGASA